MIRTILIGGALILAGTVARADDHEPEHIHFNALISEGQEQQKGLDQNFKASSDSADPSDAQEAAVSPKDPNAKEVAKGSDDAEKESVLDLVDAELTVKKSDVADKKPEHIAKRVFNSVGEPRVATLPEVQLIQKQHTGRAAADGE